MGSINEIVLFETSDKEVTLSVPMDGDTVWRHRMADARTNE